MLPVGAEITLHDEKERKKKNSHPHSTLHRIMSIPVLTDSWGGHGEIQTLFFFFVHDVVSGLSAVAVTEQCDTALPPMFCQELWLYRVILLIFHLRQHDNGAGTGVKDKEGGEQTAAQTERQADRRITAQTSRGCLTSERRAGIQKMGVWEGDLIGQVREQE